MEFLVGVILALSVGLAASFVYLALLLRKPSFLGAAA